MNPQDIVERLLADELVYNRGPDYEPLRVKPSAIRVEAATAIASLWAERDEAVLEYANALGRLTAAEYREKELTEMVRAADESRVVQIQRAEATEKERDEALELRDEAITALNSGFEGNAKRVWVKLCELSRKYAAEKANQYIAAEAEATSLRSQLQEARNSALEEAAKLVEEGFDRGITNKRETCAHKRFGWEDCETCAAAAIRSLKEKQHG